MAVATASAASRPAATLSVRTVEMKELGSAAESMPIILTFLRAPAISFWSAIDRAGAITISGGRPHHVFQNADLTTHVGFRIGTELQNIHANILSGFACAGQHDLSEQ